MTQLEKVACVLHGHTLDIQTIARACDMVEPSTRRVLGQGIYSGHFKRVSAGVYKNAPKADAIFRKLIDELVPCDVCGTLGLIETPCIYPECAFN